jgi:phage terminase small subunit
MPKVAENLTKEQRLAGWKRLTDKQQDFLDNFMHKDMTQTASARSAGYSNPGVDAVRLLRNPVVQERYQEMRDEARTRFGVTIDKSVRDLLKIRNEAWESGKFGEAIRAEELRLKATGLLVNKAHVLHERTDSLTREEILAKLQEFQDLAQKRMKVATNTHKEPKVIEQSSVKPIK